MKEINSIEAALAIAVYSEKTQRLTISDCIIKEKLSWKRILEEHDLVEISFENTVFNERLFLSNFKNISLTFKYCTFFSGIRVSRSKLKSITFKSFVEESNLVSVGFFIIQSEIDVVSISSTVFESAFRIRNSKIGKLEFLLKNDIQDVMYLTDSQFNSSVRLNKYSFAKNLYNDVRINQCEFQGGVQASGIDLKTFRITSTKLLDPLFLDRSKIKTLQISTIENAQLISFRNADIEKVSVWDVYGSGSYWMEGLKVKYTNKETARFFKSKAFEDHSIVTALNFKKIELEKYKDSLKSDFTLQGSTEKILLYFNRISNDYGISWLQGITFTISVASMFLVLICIFGFNENPFRQFFSWGISNSAYLGKVIDWLMSAFIGMINVFNFKDNIAGVELTGFGEILYYISKIFVSYGIYQTVAAFRKYGK